MRFVFLFVSLFSFASADYLYTKASNQCVYDLEPNQNSKGWCYTKRSDDSSHCNTKTKITDFISGYEYKNSECHLKNDLKITGLSQSEWSYLMAVLAHVLGFTFLFLIGFLSIKISK